MSIGFINCKKINNYLDIMLPDERKVLSDLMNYNGDLDTKKLISLSDYLDTNEDRIKTKLVFNRMIGKTDINISNELYVLNAICNHIGLIKDEELLNNIEHRINKLYDIEEACYEQNNR